MPAQTDEAIVLRLSDYSETSQIATVFAAHSGLLRLIAKGVRRGTSKRFAVGLDLLEYGGVGFVPGRAAGALGTLTEWSQVDAFLPLRTRLSHLSVALYAAEALPAVTEEADPHAELFAALLALLRGLCGGLEPGSGVVRFLQALLDAAGFTPNLAACVSCGRVRPPRRAGWYSPRVGGLLCQACQPQQAQKRPVPASVLDLVNEPDEVGPAAPWPAAFELLDEHLRYFAGQRLQMTARVRTALRSGSGSSPRR